MELEPCPLDCSTLVYVLRTGNHQRVMSQKNKNVRFTFLNIEAVVWKIIMRAEKPVDEKSVVQSS